MSNKKKVKQGIKTFPKTAVFVMAIISIAILTLIVVLIYYTAKPDYFTGTGTKLVPPWNESNLQNIEINEKAITYILYKFEANNLHNPPLSSNTPKIEFVVDDEVFGSEIKDKKIVTTKGDISNEDIRILSSRQSIIDIITASFSVSAIQAEIDNGSMKLEIIEDKATLFAKGYLSLYKKFTGDDVE